MKNRLDISPRHSEATTTVEERPTTRRERVEIVAHAVRWTRNILSEVLSNHGGYLRDDQRECVRKAVSALGEW